MRRNSTFLSIALLFLTLPGFSQVILSGISYTQNFDGLAATGTSSTLPLGWSLSKKGGDPNYVADDGSTATGNVYSYGNGADPDRALGMLQTNQVEPEFIGVQFQNGTGGIITLLNLAFTVEQWRQGTYGGTDITNFEYSLNATSITDAAATWVLVPEFTMIGPATGTFGARDGNNPANQVALIHSIGGLSIPDGATFFFRWADQGIQTGNNNEDGLAIDNVSLIMTVQAPLPVKLTNFAGQMNNKTVDLNWSTAQESNSKQFEIERSADGNLFNRIGVKAAAGESSSPLNYSFVDDSPQTGNNFYRLRMVDNDGTYEYSKVIKVYFGAALIAAPNPARGTILVTNPDSQVALFNLVDLNGRVVKQQVIPGNAVNYEVRMGALNTGIYIVRLKNSNQSAVTKFMVQGQ